MGQKEVKTVMMPIIHACRLAVGAYSGGVPIGADDVVLKQAGMEGFIGFACRLRIEVVKNLIDHGSPETVVLLASDPFCVCVCEAVPD